MKQQVLINSTLGASKVQKIGNTYVIKDVCGAVDEIVMNEVLYSAKDLEAGAPTLTDKPAPIDHPKNAAGQYISANSADGLLVSYAGAVCRNARHINRRTKTDIEINIAQANAHPKGHLVTGWAEAAVNGANPPPMHVSTGLKADMIPEVGEVDGKRYTRRATNIEYDHLALLPDGHGAGTPDQGVGVFNDGTDELQKVEVFTINAEPDPQEEPSKGFTAWLRKLLCNTAFLSSLALPADQKETVPEVEPLSTNEKEDPVKEKILAALNQAGISVTGLDDTQLLSAYNALQAKPTQDALTAANSKLAALEIAANAAADAKLTALATSLAVNTSLKPEDFKAMGLARCEELAAAGKAAPVVVGNAGQTVDEFDGYDINSHEGA